MLELLGLSKRFGEVVALDECSLNARPGRVLGFLGRNGAGKTTAMRSIFGLVQLDAGEVRWQGQPVGPAERMTFGYMPEERGLYPRMPILEQLTYFGRLHGLDSAAARREGRRWLERLDLADRADSPLDTLSHGNQQRVQLAVSLVGRPGLLVLDEPFSGLDPIASTTLSEVIAEEASRGAAVVFSSHQLDLVEGVCDDIAIVTRGKVVLTGDLEEVRRRSPMRYVDFGLDRPVYQPNLEATLSTFGGNIAERVNGHVRMQVDAATDPSEVLAAVRRLGGVEYFRFEPPRLPDIFREAVGE